MVCCIKGYFVLDFLLFLLLTFSKSASLGIALARSISLRTIFSLQPLSNRYFSKSLYLLSKGSLFEQILLVKSQCLAVSLCVCLRHLFTSSAQISWDTMQQINDVMLMTLISYAKSRHYYLRMQPLTFLTSYFILFSQKKQAKPRLNQCTSRFQKMGHSFTIKQASPSVRTSS